MAVLSGLLLGTSAASQSPEEEIKVDEGRPLAEAVVAISARTRVPITYEDPPYLYPGDTAPAPGGVVPRVGPLEFRYAPDSSVLEVLRLAIQEAARRGYPGVFEVRPDAGWYHVVPVKARDRKGELVSVRSILDTPVTVPVGKTTRLNIVRAICAEVSRRAGVRIVPGMMSPNIFLKDQAWHDARPRPARDHLTRLLEDIGGSLIWLLFYDPADHFYALNIEPIRARK
jgi:hypothetical protein